MSYSCSRLAVILLTALLGGSMTPGLHAQSAAANTPAIKPCKDEAAYHKLDFWLGHWEVFDLHGGSKDGTDSVEKILKGCAIVEIWHDIEGYEGRSLFYYQRATKHMEAGLGYRCWTNEGKASDRGTPGRRRAFSR